MFNNYMISLRNEITSNFGIYDGENEFKFIFAIKTDKDLKVDFLSIYEKMFNNKNNYEKYSISALTRFYGNVDEGIKEALRTIISGNFEGIKSRNPDSIKILTILSEIVDIIEKGRSKEIIESVRNADEEFNNLKIILSKLTGAFKKEDSDKFKIISKLYSYFKNRNSRAFNPLVKKYAEISDTVIDLKDALKNNKKATNQLLELFNTNEAEYSETIEELISISSTLFGKEIHELKDLIKDQISDEQIDEYKSIILFYLQHLDSLVELATGDINEIILHYSALIDSKIEDLKKLIVSAFGENSIANERILGSKEYMFALSFTGRYEPIIKFIEDNELKVFTVLIVLPNTEESIIKNPSLGFLITSLAGDFDKAIDEYGKHSSIDVRKIGNQETVYLIGTSTNNEEGKEQAMIIYLSILAVIHGFDAKKLPFVQKFIG